MTLRHRYLIAAPLLLVLIVMLVGGVLNTTDARARLVDDLSDKPVVGATITHGSRTARSDANGEFVLTSLPRTSKYQIDRNGYMRTSAPTYAEEIRLKPFSLTVYAYDASKTPDARVKNPQARQGDKTLATGTEGGQIIVAPYPSRDAKILICAEGFTSKEITADGVLMEVGLEPGGPGCPPLPLPSPAPGATPSPAGPAPSPVPSPTRSP